jgi:hypothetical protein
VRADVAHRLELGEEVRAARHLPRLLDPVLREGRLQLRHDRPFHPRADVAEVLLVLRLPQPVVGEAMSAHVRDAPVDDEDLAVIAIVDQAEVGDQDRVVPAHLRAGFLQQLESLLSELLAAAAVEHHPHLHLLARLGRQRLGHAPRELPLLAEKRLVVDGLARGGDVGEDAVPHRPVLQQLDAVAADARPLRQPRDRRDEVLEAGRLQSQVRTPAPLHGPEDEQQDGDGQRQQPEDPDRYVHRSFSSATMAQ